MAMHPPADAGTALGAVDGAPELPLYSLAEAGVLPFVAIPLALAALAVAGVAVAAQRLGEGASSASRAIAGTGIVAAAWLAVSWCAARSGALAGVGAAGQGLLLAGAVGLAFGLAWSGYGRRLARGLPLWSLVLLQAFRWPLALALEALSARGIAPAASATMAYGLDVATGVAAVAISVLA